MGSDAVGREGREAVAERDAHLRLILDQIPTAVWTTDADLRFTYAQAARSVSERSGADIAAGRSLLDYVPADDPAVRAHQRALGGESAMYQTTWQGRTFEAHVEPLREDSGAIVGVIGAGIDVSRRLELEQQLRQAQKMEAVGRLAGGIAHDFNNLLAIVRSYSDLLIRTFDDGDERRADVEEIRHAADRAAALTRQLLVFSRRQTVEPRLLDLNRVVEEAEKMLRRLIHGGIELRTVLEPSLHLVRADPGQLEQVLLNLVINARDALPAGGTVTVRTSNAEVDAALAASHPGATPGPHVLLQVRDTGVGMDADTLSHVFEPFFTTKEEGAGTGLGLATVYGIVRQCGGVVVVRSRPGEGTAVRVYLPAVERS